MHPSDLQQLVADVRADLLGAGRHKIAGFGTFSRCTRKAAPGRPACSIAMFRPDAALRAHVSGGPVPPSVSAHPQAVDRLIAGMQEPGGVDVPGLGHLEVLRAAGKKPRLVFHGDKELNALLPLGRT